MGSGAHNPSPTTPPPGISRDTNSVGVTPASSLKSRLKWGLVADAQLGGESAVGEDTRGLGGQNAKQPRNLGESAGIADIAKVASSDVSR